jgi:Ca2+-binding EF-hand superfamily protein
LLLVLISVSISCSKKKKEMNGQFPSVDELFSKMDTNKDGKLSKVEIKGPLKNDFEKVDTNKDGFITKEELTKAPKPNAQNPSQEQGRRQGPLPNRGN